MKVAGELLGNLHDAYVAGDRAYDALALVLQLQQQGCQVVIPVVWKALLEPRRLRAVHPIPGGLSRFVRVG